MNTNSVNPLSFCILETNPLIQKGKETLYHWHKRVHQRLTPLISKICAFISEIFERIRIRTFWETENFGTRENLEQIVRAKLCEKEEDS